MSRPSSNRSSTSDDARARPDLAHAVLVRVHQPELLVGLEALADQLAVARLEDVQRHPLGRKQDDAEREEADLRHRPKGTPPSVRMAAWLSNVSRPCCAVRFPDADELRVEDRTGGGDHFQVIVTSPRFDGLPLLDQHRLVNEALAEPLRDGTIHELRIKTRGTT